jgi:Tfp pilus assembly protein PilF
MTESAQAYRRALSEMRKEQWLSAIKLLKLELAAIQRDWRFSWNLGWCYFKLEKFNDARKQMVRAMRLAPENLTCKWGLGSVYLKTRQFKKAELVLKESLTVRESHLTRIALAFAYLSRGKVAEAEKVHLEGIKLKPKSSQRYESYAAFLSDIGRDAEAQTMSRKAKRLQHVH